MTGRFIVIEGPDGSGTTLHSKLLAERLMERGIDVLVTSEPTDGPIGTEIRSMLCGNEMPQADAVQLLFCADRAEHVAKVILPALEKGTTVISDRYSLSTIVYGAAQGLDEKWLHELNDKFPLPDIRVIALPPLETCLERMKRRDTLDQYENGGLQKKVYEGYKNVDLPDTIFVDTSKEKQKTADEIWSHIEPLFQPISRENIVELNDI